MCNGKCNLFLKQGASRYCQKCARYVSDQYTYLEEKRLQRKRCLCCNGLLRNSVKSYKASSAQAIKNINFSS